MKSRTGIESGDRRKARGPAVAVVAVSAALLVLVAACAKQGSGGGGGGVEHPTGHGQLVLRVDTAGGFIAPGATFSLIPSFSLYGDGLVVVPGVQTEIYPGPALATPLSFHVTEDGIQAILAAARAAGLLGASKVIGGGIPDIGTTTFTVIAGGGRHVVSAVGLGAGEGPGAGGASGGDTNLRKALIAFQAKLFDLASWLPKGSVGEEKPFAFDGLLVYVHAGAPAAEPGLTEPTIDWPLLAEPLATFGQPVAATATGGGLPHAGSFGYRCGSLTGEDLKATLPLAQRANQLTPWRSEGRTYSLIFRPMLPDESGCPQTVGA